MNSTEQLAIVQKYEVFLNYFYPIAQNIPIRVHLINESALLSAHDAKDLATGLTVEDIRAALA